MKLPIKILVAVLAVLGGAQANAQERAGVVTTAEGRVTVTRASISEPAPMKFKDDVFVHDRIATGKDSIARMLLGGRAVVTVREHSAVTITETPGVATVEVATGRVAVAVAREKMRQGDVVQVKTPNAIAGIRGTVIVAEVLSPTHSVVTVLKGTIDVTRLEAGQLVGAATIVDALQRVIVSGAAPVSAPERIELDAARQLGQQFRLAPPRTTPPAVAAAVNAGEVARVAKDAAALPRRVVADRGPRANVVDDDPDDAITQDGRGVPGLEKMDKVGTADRGPKARVETPTYEAPPIVKNSGRTSDAVSDATKSIEKNGRGKGGGRDR